MMAAGFLEEVRHLHARGDLTPSRPAVRAVGYRQLWQHLDGAVALDEAVHNAIVATRRLAKRQMTWLRALPQAKWLNSSKTAATRFSPGCTRVSERALAYVKIFAKPAPIARTTPHGSCQGRSAADTEQT